MAVITPDPLIGRVIDDKYQIAERIGSGGMGAVYKAVHVSLGALRAIKVMKRELLQDAAFVERFQNEARIAEGLRHPHLVALYDFARLEDGSWYIVSEYVEGDSLASLLKRKVVFRSADVAALLGQICEGLGLAHRKGIVHRDISPDNIMIARGEAHEPVAKLLDFGIAKEIGAESGHTASGMLLGKIGYSAPEQMGLLPKGERIDGRADVFSLAAVGFEMLAARLPWRKDSLQSYVHDLLVRPERMAFDEIDKGVPAEWRDVFKNGLARQREQRTPSLQVLRAEMLGAARRFADAERGQPATRTIAATLPATEATWRKVPPPPARKSSLPVWAIAAAVVAVAAVGVGVGTALMLSGRTPGGSNASPAPALASLSPPVAPSASPTPIETLSAAAPAPEASPSPGPTPRQQTRPVEARALAGATPAPAPVAPTNTSLPRPGTVLVRSTPNAAITLDGQPVGRTPATLSSVAPGRHSLVLVADDGRRLAEEIAVAPGETVVRELRLPGFGSLSVTADVWAEVSVDGSAPQQTPLRIDRLSAGSHTVRAFRRGYKERVYSIDVKEADTYLLKVALERQ